MVQLMRANMQQLMAKSFSYPVYVLAWRSWSHGFPTGGVTCFREGMVEYPCDASSYGNGRLQCLNSDHLALDCLMGRPIFYKFMWWPITQRRRFNIFSKKICSMFNNFLFSFCHINIINNIFLEKITKTLIIRVPAGPSNKQSWSYAHRLIAQWEIQPIKPTWQNSAFTL